MYLSSDGERFDTEGCVIPNGNSSTHVFYVSTNKTCDCHLLAYPVIRDQSIHSRALFRDDCRLCFFPRKWLTTSDTDCNVTLSYTSHFWCATQHPAQYGVPFLSKNKLSLLLQEAHTNVKAGDTSGGCLFEPCFIDLRVTQLHSALHLWRPITCYFDRRVLRMMSRTKLARRSMKQWNHLACLWQTF